MPVGKKEGCLRRQPKRGQKTGKSGCTGVISEVFSILPYIS